MIDEKKLKKAFKKIKDEMNEINKRIDNLNDLLNVEMKKILDKLEEIKK